MYIVYVFIHAIAVSEKGAMIFKERGRDILEGMEEGKGEGRNYLIILYSKKQLVELKNKLSKEKANRYFKR